MRLNHALILLTFFLSTIAASANPQIFSTDDIQHSAHHSAPILVGCDVGELSAAIKTAVASPEDDVIELATDCVYTLTQALNSDGDQGGNALPTITDATVSGAVTINGNGAIIERGGEIAFRILRIDVGAIVTLNDTTIRNRKVRSDGGGIDNYGFLTIQNCSFTDNVAWNGGAIHNLSEGTLIINDSIFLNNFAFGSGGAIGNRGMAIIHRSVFQDNVDPSPSDAGGAIFNWGTMLIYDSIFRDNYVSTTGGAIINYNNGFMLISGGEFVGNEASLGSAIGNRGDMMIIGSTISGNTAGYGGGAITSNSRLSIINSTIVDNLSENNTGGISGDNNMVIYNSIVAGNSINGNYQDPNSNCSFTGTISGETDFEGSNNIYIPGTGCDDIMSNSIAIDPTTLFTDVLGPLADNGGITLSHAPLPGSVAINAGDNSYLYESVLGVDMNNDGDLLDRIDFDQRGEGFYRVSAGTVDIGAVEVSHTRDVILNEQQLLAYMREAIPADVMELVLIDITPSGAVATIRLPDGTVGTATMSIALNEGLLTINIEDIQAEGEIFVPTVSDWLPNAMVYALNSAFDTDSAMLLEIRSLTIMDMAFVFVIYV